MQTKEERREGALARRKLDVKKYEKLLKGEPISEFEGRSFASPDEWSTFIERKLKLANKDCATLAAKLPQVNAN